MTDFHGAHPALAKALSTKGFETLTPVQKAVLASDLKGADALVSAQTGSGKTVAFGLALAPDLLEGNDRFGEADTPLALVIAPTRELAMQVKKELEWLYGDTGAKIASCVGGMDIRTERRALFNGAHIVVGTPGRLCDHIKRNALKLSSLKAVVLDEADEMLDLGFREDLEFILESAPEERRTLMFSATVSRSIGNLAKTYQRNAVRIETKSEEKQHRDIEYRALLVSGSDRENAIINVLRYYEAHNALVFCATRAMVNYMTARFTNRGFSVVALSGELSQSERTHALQAMRDGRARVCIATDVAARGIDLPGLELVVHAELPKTSETLLHRSGRTGRAGNKGVCAIMVPYSQRRKAERLLDRAKITAGWAKPPTADEVLQQDDERLMSLLSIKEPIEPQEQKFVSKIAETFSPDDLARAILRLYRKDHSAPEDISLEPGNEEKSRERRPRKERKARDGKAFDQGSERKPFERKEARGKDRNEFDKGVWFSLSVGRKHKAEPKWLIPMLCRAGDFNKPQIGAIRIHDSETHVEIDANHVDRFLAGLGDGGTLEKGISAKRLDKKPSQQGKENKDGQPDHSQKEHRPHGDQKRTRRIASSERPKKASRRSVIDDVLGDFDEPLLDEVSPSKEADGFIGNKLNPPKSERKSTKKKQHKGKEKSKGKPGWAKAGGKKNKTKGSQTVSSDGSQPLKRSRTKINKPK